ncbi:MFS general substrate transporter [Xylariaceae sp. FL1651]|nr:MFS general substrate transporter [Xylariaceae sp. FL1651]
MISESLLNTLDATRSGPNLQSWRLGIIIGSLALGIFLLGLDQNIIGVAIPRITTDFKSLDDIAWYGSAYLLTITAFQPFFGSLYKYFDAKSFELSANIYTLGSVICASAKQSDVLIFGRAFLGFGAAGLLQGALAIIGYVVRLEKLPLFQGIVVSSLGISVSVGPVLGGVLTDRVGWRWCFWINVPIGVVIVFAIFFFVHIEQSAGQVDHNLPLRTKLQQMDAIGTLLFLGAVVSLILVLQWGGQVYPWNDSKCIGLFVSFGTISIVFCFWEWKQGETAILPFRILKKRSIYMGALVLFALGMSSLAYAYYLPIYFQSVQGVSTTQSGARFIAIVLPQIVGLVIVGAIVTQWGYYVPYMILGVIVTSIGAGLLTTIGVSTPTVRWAAYMVINGLGIGMAQQLPYTALQAVLEPVDVPTGNGMICLKNLWRYSLTAAAIAVFSYQLGGALSVAIGQNLLLNKLKITVPRHTDKITAQAVIEVGATGLTHLTSDPKVLSALRLAYAEAVRDPLILALAATLLAFPFACCMERLNVKVVAEQRLEERHQMEELNTERTDLAILPAQDLELAGKEPSKVESRKL